jgi:hypothetical protein
VVRSVLKGTPVVAATAEGISLVLEEPLSWWGGIDSTSGAVIDRHHPQYGAETSGRILILPHGRGSSGGSAVLAESIRAGTGPAGLVLRAVDPILVVGLLAAAELYPGRPCPLVVVAEEYERLTGGSPTRIRTDGTVEQW